MGVFAEHRTIGELRGDATDINKVEALALALADMRQPASASEVVAQAKAPGRGSFSTRQACRLLPRHPQVEKENLDADEVQNSPHSEPQRYYTTEADDER